MRSSLLVQPYSDVILQWLLGRLDCGVPVQVVERADGGYEAHWSAGEQSVGMLLAANLDWEVWARDRNGEEILAVRTEDGLIYMREILMDMKRSL